MRRFSAFVIVGLCLATSAGAQTITTVAGTGTSGFCGDGGPATSACTRPYGVAVDVAGNVLIAERSNHRVRKVDATGTITTVAGGGGAGYCGDGGPATSACLNGPAAVAVDAAGNLFIAERGNHRVRRVSAGGTISTVAGGGGVGFCGDGGPAASACLHDPIGVAVDTAGNLFIAEYEGGRVRKVDAGGTITTVPGSTWAPFGVAVAGGNLFVADYDGDRVQMVDATGTVTTVAGTGSEEFCGDGGPATSACLHHPAGVIVDAAGNLFIADRFNHRVRKVDATGTITTVAGNGSAASCGDGGPATSACVREPLGVAVDAEGSLFIAESLGYRIRKVTFPPVGPLLTSLTLKKPTVAGCKPMTGTVTLSAPAPAGGITITLSETLGSASVPATLAIPAGATSKTFKVTTIPVGVLEAGTVSASYGGTTLAKPLTVRPMSVLSILLTPNPVAGGDAVSGVVKLECKAQPAAILVTLGSTSAGVAGPTVPSVLVVQGVQTAPFSVATTPVGVTAKPKITATANGLTKSKPLTVTP